MSKLVFNIPDRDAPGFLRRQRRYAELQRLMARGKNLEGSEASEEEIAQTTVDVIDQMLDFMLDFVSEPGPDEATEILLDMSEDEFTSTFESFGKNAIRRTAQNKKPSGATATRKPAPARGRSRS